MQEKKMMDLKKRAIKVKRSDERKLLLLENSIEVKSNGSIPSESRRYVGWILQANGRVKFQDEEPNYHP